MAGKKEVTKFVILTTARSGSSWLADTVDHIGEVTCYGELFNGSIAFDDLGGGTKRETFSTFRKKHVGIRPFITFKYLEEVFNLKGTIGFKLLMTQVRRLPEVFLYLVLKRAAIIHLVRENTVDILVSKKAAWHRGKFVYKKGEPIPPEVALHYPTERLLAELEWTERRTNQIRWLLRFLRLRRLEVRYEDLLEGPAGFKPVWQFFGINFETDPPQWEIQKIRKKSLPELITNYAEIEQALAGTKYAKYLSQ